MSARTRTAAKTAEGRGKAGTKPTPAAPDARRGVPSVDTLLRSGPGRKGVAKFGRAIVKQALNAALPKHYVAHIEEEVLEPAIIPLALNDLDELHHRWIEIQRLPERTLVTVIELLSPTNKYQPGRSKYLEKRNALNRALVAELGAHLGAMAADTEALPGSAVSWSPGSRRTPLPARRPPAR